MSKRKSQFVRKNGPIDEVPGWGGRVGMGGDRFSVSMMFAQICRHLAKGSLIPSEELKRLMKRKWKLVLWSQQRELPHL